MINNLVCRDFLYSHTLSRFSSRGYYALQYVLSFYLIIVLYSTIFCNIIVLKLYFLTEFQDISDSRDSMIRCSVDYHHDGKSSQNTGNQVKRVQGGDGECGNSCGTDPL